MPLASGMPLVPIAGMKLRLRAKQLWRGFAPAVGLLAVVLGGGVLVGWWGDLAALRAPVPGAPAMKPNTALMFVLCGLALFSRGRAEPSVRHERAGIAPALIALAIAAATLFEHAAGVELGIDGLVAGASSGAPSPSTASAFLLLSVALLLPRAPDRRRAMLVEALALIAATNAMLALLGFSLGVVFFDAEVRLPVAIGMAPHSAAGLLLLAAGVLVARRDAVLTSLLTSRGSGGEVARRLLLVALVTIPVTTVAAFALERRGWWPTPGAAVVAATTSAMVLVLALRITGRRLDAVESQRTRLAADLQRAMAESARLAALVTSADDAIIAESPEGVVLDWNQGAERLYGWSAAEMLGRSIDAIIPEEDRAVRRDLRERAAAGVVMRGLECVIVNKNGGRIPVSLTLSPIGDEAGSVSAISRDLTEVKAAQAVLAKSGELFAEVARANLLVTEATAAMPETGLPRVLEVIAEQARKLTGAELAGVGLGARAPFQHWVRVGAAAEQGSDEHPLLAASAELGEIVRVANVREDPRFRDGVPEHSQIESLMGIPVRYRGEITGHLCLANKHGGGGFSAQDQSAVELIAAHVGAAIEASRLYEREAIQRARLESIVAQLPVGVVVIDAQAQLVLQNQASLELAKSIRPMVHDVRLPSGEALPAEDHPVIRALRTGERIASQELKLELGSGEQVPILASAAPVRSGDEIVGAVTAFRDIRAIKELERMREEWASVIAHDMRQPVNSIWLNSDLLKGAPLSQREQNQVARIRRAAERLNRMVEDLLDISQVESRHLALCREPLRLGSALAEALAGVPDIGARCQLELDDAELLVLADSVRFQQILENLLSNAEKYGEPGTPVVVRSRREQSQVVISVENRGPGILPDELRTLFERFSRARSAHAGPARGLGLGLYICRGLVEAHGGRIWVESVPGGTTTFHFTLPIALEAELAQTMAHARAS